MNTLVHPIVVHQMQQENVNPENSEAIPDAAIVVPIEVQPVQTTPLKKNNVKIVLRGNLKSKYWPLIWMELDCVAITKLQTLTLSFITLDNYPLDSSMSCVFLRNDCKYDRASCCFNNGFKRVSVPACEPTKVSILAQRIAFECAKNADLKLTKPNFLWVLLTHGLFGSLYDQTVTNISVIVCLCVGGEGIFCFEDSCGENMVLPIKVGSCFIFHHYDKHCWKSNNKTPLTIVTLKCCEQIQS